MQIYLKIHKKSLHLTKILQTHVIRKLKFFPLNGGKIELM